MSVQRRTFFASLAAATTGLLAMARARAADAPPRQKVVYHLSDLDKVSFVLGNMQNHVEGTGGPGKADIRLVVHGPALRGFLKAGADARVAGHADKLLKAQVGFEACGNTMKGLSLGLADLLPGFVVVEQGGVVRLAELQQQGYAYLRP
jgi:intracellular sulfur oxidation DsrE/DsrF family protein